MIAPFEFDSETAIEAILYIANKVNEPTFHSISKIMYFADTDHLKKYGRFICGDSYVAMKHGPVPSGMYDFLKTVRKGSYGILQHGIKDKLKKAFTVYNDYFSESDLECLDKAIKKYGNMSFNELTELSHKGAWELTQDNDLIEIEQIVSTFENADSLLEYLRDPHPG